LPWLRGLSRDRRGVGEHEHGELEESGEEELEHVAEFTGVVCEGEVYDDCGEETMGVL
jgi:hypothetical protein